MCIRYLLAVSISIAFTGFFLGCSNQSSNPCSVTEDASSNKIAKYEVNWYDDFEDGVVGQNDPEWTIIGAWSWAVEKPTWSSTQKWFHGYGSAGGAMTRVANFSLNRNNIFVDGVFQTLNTDRVAIDFLLRISDDNSKYYMAELGAQSLSIWIKNGQFTRLAQIPCTYSINKSYKLIFQHTNASGSLTATVEDAATGQIIATVSATNFELKSGGYGLRAVGAHSWIDWFHIFTS